MSTSGQRQLDSQQNPVMSCSVHTAEELLLEEDIRMHMHFPVLSVGYPGLVPLMCFWL